jgi:hypothetical protein
MPQTKEKTKKTLPPKPDEKSHPDPAERGKAIIEWYKKREALESESDTMEYDESKSVDKAKEELQEAKKGEDLPDDINEELTRRRNIKDLFKKKPKKLSRKKRKKVEKVADKIVKDVRR